MTSTIRIRLAGGPLLEVDGEVVADRGPKRQRATLALAYLVYVLIVVAVGGLGSIGGSFAAAVVLGISDMAGKYYVPWLGAFLIYLVMVGLLMWRPLGLFGKR